jgi:hypothetical protein
MRNLTRTTNRPAAHTWLMTSLLLLLGRTTPAFACECELRSSDQRAVQRVQSSWTTAYSSIHAGDYAKALREVRSTAAFVTSIHDAATRQCVAAGANNLIASAVAGETYLTAHPRDVAGAKEAAGRAWHLFLNCR